MLLLLLMSPPAEAKVAGCEGHRVSGVSPLPDADGVPVDVVPQLTFDHGGCPGAQDWTLALTEITDAGELPVAEETVTISGDPFEAYAAFSELPELAPDTPHVLGVYRNGGLVLETGFTTGQAQVQGLADGQDLNATLLQLTTQRSTKAQQRGGVPDWTLFGRFEVDTVDDPDGLSVLLLVDTEAPELPIAAGRLLGGDTQDLTVTQVSEDPQRGERCYQVLQTDGHAQVVAESLEICSSPRRGCQSAPGGSLALALGAILGLIRRRRRSG